MCWLMLSHVLAALVQTSTVGTHVLDEWLPDGVDELIIEAHHQGGGHHMKQPCLLMCVSFVLFLWL